MLLGSNLTDMKNPFFSFDRTNSYFLSVLPSKVELKGATLCSRCHLVFGLFLTYISLTRKVELRPLNPNTRFAWALRASLISSFRRPNEWTINLRAHDRVMHLRSFQANRQRLSCNGNSLTSDTVKRIVTVV